MTESTRMAERNRLLSVLLHVSNLSAQDADPRTLAEAVLERLHGLLFCDASLCYILEGNRLVNVARKGPLRDYVGRHPLSNQILPFGQGFLNQRQPLLVPDLMADDESTVRLRERLSLFLDGPGSVGRCWLLLPMVLRGRPMGALVITHHEPGQFSLDDKVFGAAFAHQAAIEFENARLAREARKREAEVRTMLQVQRAIARRVEPEAVLRQIADEARRLTRAGGSVVFLREPAGWRLAGASGETAHQRLEPQTAVSPAQSALEGMAATRRAYLLRRAREGSTRHDMLLRHYGMDSLLCVPILAGSETEAEEPGVLGILGVTRPPEGGFGTDDLRILALLASSTVMGVENARLYEAERKLRQQAAEQATVAERVRLARELHDAVTQTLFSASLTAEVLPRIWARDPELAREKLEEIRLLNRGALAEMRTLLLELRPRAMEETALEELLKQLVNATSGRARIPVTSKLTGCADLPFDVKLGLYRIAQEAMNNIVKHANAEHIDVTVTGTCAGADHAQGKLCIGLVMEIRDDGDGFDPGTVPGGHFGVGIMRERAASFGGTIEVESAIGAGTCIRVHWQAPQAE